MYRIPLWIMARPFYAVAPWSLLLRLATVNGALMSLLSRRRAQGLRRIGKVHPGASRREIRRLARQHFQFLGRERLANQWPCIRGFRGSEKIDIEGQHHLDEALRAGRGAIVLTLHFGYARLLKPILVSRGYRALLIGPPRDLMIRGFPPLSRLGRLVRLKVLRLPWPGPEDEVWMRTAGYDLRAQLNIRPHLAALARNEILISLPEGKGALAMHRVSMMGIDVLLSPNVLSMARHTGAAVLPAFVGEAGGEGPIGLRLVIDRPLVFPTDTPDQAAVAAGLQSLASIFESWIRASPHLWSAWSGPPLSWWGDAAKHAVG